MAKELKNCREYCRFARCCYVNGEDGLDPDDCPVAWKIEDLLNDAENDRYDPDEPDESELDDDEETED